MIQSARVLGVSSWTENGADGDIGGDEGIEDLIGIFWPRLFNQITENARPEKL
jgi:hypothetical protein